MIFYTLFIYKYYYNINKMLIYFNSIYLNYNCS